MDFAGRPQKGGPWVDRYCLVSFEIPGATGEVGVGQRTINWVWYDSDCMVAFWASGRVQDDVVKRSLLSHELRPMLAGRLEKLARIHWPTPGGAPY